MTRSSSVVFLSPATDRENAAGHLISNELVDELAKGESYFKFLIRVPVTTVYLDRHQALVFLIMFRPRPDELEGTDRLFAWLACRCQGVG